MNFIPWNKYFKSVKSTHYVFVSKMPYRASELWSKIALVLAIWPKMHKHYYLIYQCWAYLWHFKGGRHSFFLNSYISTLYSCMGAYLHIVNSYISPHLLLGTRGIYSWGHWLTSRPLNSIWQSFRLIKYYSSVKD